MKFRIFKSCFFPTSTKIISNNMNFSIDCFPKSYYKAHFLFKTYWNSNPFYVSRFRRKTVQLYWVHKMLCSQVVSRSAHADPHRRTPTFMWCLQQKFCTQEGPALPWKSSSHRRKTLLVHGLWQMFCSETKSENPRKDAHWGEAVFMWSMWKEIFARNQS